MKFRNDCFIASGIICPSDYFSRTLALCTFLHMCTDTCMYVQCTWSNLFLEGVNVILIKAHICTSHADCLLLDETLKYMYQNLGFLDLLWGGVGW